MNIVIRVDASIFIGNGHVMRCLTLADKLKENGSNVIFICRKFEGNLINKIRANGFDVLELKHDFYHKVIKTETDLLWLGVTQKEDAKQCERLIKDIKVDWLIVDHYGINEDWHKILKHTYSKLMVIDDLSNRVHQCDLLLDQTFGRKKNDYEELVPKFCELLVGANYALLRPEFAYWRKYSLDRRQKKFSFKKLFVNMGGVDPHNYTEKVLLALENCNLPIKLEVVVVMGGTSPHLDKVLAIANTFPYKIKIQVDPDNIAEIMANSDLAIGASGSTSLERSCLGLPTIQLVTAQNQELTARLLDENNLIKLISKVDELPNLFFQPVSWAETLSHRSSKITNGAGVVNVLSRIQ